MAKKTNNQRLAENRVVVGVTHMTKYEKGSMFYWIDKIRQRSPEKVNPDG